MNKRSPEIASLRLDIEKNVQRKIRTPYDFEYLTGVVWERLHENISPTTLKRLWGYIEGADTTRRTTLCLLAKFLGYADWEEYLQVLTERDGTESAGFVGEGIRCDDLSEGDKIEVTWLPNRRCTFQYEGNSTFVVLASEHSKLQAGDRFKAACFLIGQPMYLDNLVRGEEPATSYVARSKHGIQTIDIIKDQL